MKNYEAELAVHLVTAALLMLAFGMIAAHGCH